MRLGGEMPEHCRNLQVAGESQLWLARRWLASVGWLWCSRGGGAWWLWEPVTDIWVGFLAQTDGGGSGLCYDDLLACVPLVLMHWTGLKV